MDFHCGNGSSAKSFKYNLALKNNDPGKSQIRSLNISDCFSLCMYWALNEIELLVGYKSLKVTKKLHFSEEFPLRQQKPEMITLVIIIKYYINNNYQIFHRSKFEIHFKVFHISTPPIYGNKELSQEWPSVVEHVSTITCSWCNTDISYRLLTVLKSYPH